MHTKGIKEQAEGVLRTNSREGFSEPSHLVVGTTNPPAEFFLALLKAPQRWKSANCESCCSAFWGVSNWNVGLCHFGASRQICSSPNSSSRCLITKQTSTRASARLTELD